MGKSSRVKWALTAAFLLILYSTVYSQTGDAFKATYLPRLEVPRLEGNIQIDGDLGDLGWQKAGVVDNFCEHSPGDQTKPPVSSKALITYDRGNLYIALIAWDDPRTIRASLRDRDEIFRDDYFGLLLDTYGDASWAYELFVNPYGIQGDLKIQTSGNEDMSFDIVWESMGKITDSGYQVEIAIPFASLRFPDRPEQEWRADFWRDHQREKRRRYHWAAENRDNPCWLCQWGYLAGIKDIQPGKSFDVMPNVIAFQSGARAIPEDPQSDFHNSDPEAELSLNVRYGLSSNASLEGALNPDFSQVESDAGQIDVNNNFGLFYQESRPFFQEGSELFSTWIEAVYTRSINDPRGAAKFAGQFNRTSVAYLFARDEHSTLTLPMQQQSLFGQADKSTINILRARRALWENSFVGLILTDRRLGDFGRDDEHKGGSGTVAGVDGAVQFLKNCRLEMQAMISHTEEITDAHPVDTTFVDDTTIVVDTASIVGTNSQQTFGNGRYTVDLDGESYYGHAIYLSFERNTRNWNLDADYWEYTPTFRTDNGFTTRNDYRTINVWTGPFFRPNKEWLISWEPSIGIGRSWVHNGQINIFEFDEAAFDEWIRPALYFNFKGQTDLYLEYLNSQERYNGILFPGISIGTINIDSRFSEMLSCGVSYSEGRTIRRNRFSPELGYGTNFSIYANIKPTKRLFVQPDLDYSRLDHQNNYFDDPTHAGDPKKIFEGYIFRTRLTYQFTRELFLRLVVQYNDFAEAVDIEPLLTYKVNPFTKFYVGMASSYLNHEAFDSSTLEDNQWSLEHRQFFAKFQYLFQI